MNVTQSHPVDATLGSDYDANSPDQDHDDDDEELGFTTPSFAIGYRFVTRKDKTGIKRTVEVPLSRADALHPREYDEFVATPGHALVLSALISLAQYRFRDDPTFWVLSDTNVNLGLKIRDIRPDLMLLTGVVNQRDLYLATFRFDGEPEPPRCRLVIEATSPKTRSNDLEPKLAIYNESQKIEQYLIADFGSPKRRRKARLLNYLPSATGFELQANDAEGRAYIPCLDVWLHFDPETSELQCFDGQTNQLVPDLGRSIEQTAAEKARADQAETQAQLAKDEAKLARDVADAEKKEKEQALEQVRLLQEQLRKLQTSVVAGGNGSNGASHHS